MNMTAQALFGWTLAAGLAMVAATAVLRGGRRRAAINEALHELRRPLQALVLAGPSPAGADGALESSTRLAAAALERLDRAVNGGPEESVREPVGAEAMVRSAVGRWRARAALAGGSLELRWKAGRAAVDGDRGALEQAVDNLIVNAIEHGGPTIRVEGRRRAAGLCVSVIDSGRESRPESRREGPFEVIARVSGGRRRGHGLAVVRRVAAAHGGRFVLRQGGGETVATLELPLAPAAAPDRVA
jgi:signal transduction histidine kinase